MSNAGERYPITDDDILDAIRECDRPYTTAKRLSQKFPITRQAIGIRLRRLADEGRVIRDKVGGGGVVYLLPDDTE